MTKKNILPLLGAFSFFFSTLEYLIPKPIPFFRIGFANIPILISLPFLSFKELSILVFLKVMGQAIINGTLISYIFIFSLFGSVSSFLGMYFLYKIAPKKVGFVGISVFGSFISNLVQSILSVYVIFGTNALIIIPMLLIIGNFGGLLVGIFCQVLANKSVWYKNIINSNGENNIENESSFDEGLIIKKNIKKKKFVPLKDFFEGKITPSWRFFIGLLLIPIFLYHSNIYLKIFQVIIFVILVRLSGKKLMYLYFLFMILSITFFNLITPDGQVLYTLFGFNITSGALIYGFLKSFNILGLVFISLFCIHKNLNIPTKLGKLWGETFLCYQKINEHRHIFDYKNLMGSIDELLFVMERETENIELKDDDSKKISKTSLKYKILTILFVILNLIPIFIFT